MHRFPFFVAAATLTLAPALAFAQAPAPPPNSEFWRQPGAAEPTRSALETHGLEGFELAIRGGLVIPDAISPVLAPNIYPSANDTGDILRGVEKPYGYSLASLSLTGGYRFLPWLSAGVFFDLASYSSLDGTDTGDYSDTTDLLQRVSWQLGAYGRFYLTTLHPRFHPWVELGLGYSDDTASYIRAAAQGSMAATPVNYYISDQGLAVNGRIGADVRLTPFLSLGPILGYERIVPLQGCVQLQPVTDMDNIAEIPTYNTCSGPTVQTSGWGQGYLGIYLKLTLFGPVLR